MQFIPICAMSGCRLTEHKLIGPFSNRSPEWALCCPDCNQNFRYDVKWGQFRVIWDQSKLTYLFITEIASSVILLVLWCDFDRAWSLICGNKMPTGCNRGFYFRSYCLLNMFRAPLCPSSGAQEYYTVVAACGISCRGFQVVGLVWSWGLCVRFAGCCSILQTKSERTCRWHWGVGGTFTQRRF